MTKQDIAFVGCRLIALLALYNAISKAGLVALRLLELSGKDIPGFTPFPALIPIGVEVAAFFLLWFFAAPISALVAGTKSHNGEHKNWSEDAVIAVSMTVIGIALFAYALPLTISAMTDLFSYGLPAARNLLPSLGLLAVGLALTLGHEKLTGLIRRLRGRQ